jgi:hypothetical protein
VAAVRFSSASVNASVHDVSSKKMVIFVVTSGDPQISSSVRNYDVLVEVKKVHPITGHEGPEVG